jgi:tRNA (mo5U34)-methyltransferase
VLATDVQAEIDRISWYHEFEFPGGLKARSATPDVAGHRTIWQFIERQLEAIEFPGKTVLDVGCWDGYWSFYAERRGALSILASDDVSQNWSGGDGLLLARELLNSSVMINQNLSVYRLASLGRTFDIILCLGVYYHLIDPFYAFTQLRHCCHPGTIVLLEGDVGIGLRRNEVRYCLDDTSKPAFVPSEPALERFLNAAYLRVLSQARLHPAPPGIRGRLRRAFRQWVTTSDRAFYVCAAFEGVNPMHHYEPPFGLDAYDDRFRDR